MKAKGLLSAAQGKDPVNALEGTSVTGPLPVAAAPEATLHPR